MSQEHTIQCRQSVDKKKENILKLIIKISMKGLQKWKHRNRAERITEIKGIYNSTNIHSAIFHIGLVSYPPETRFVKEKYKKYKKHKECRNSEDSQQQQQKTQRQKQ